VTRRDLIGWACKTDKGAAMRTPEPRDVGMVAFAVALLVVATPLRMLWMSDAADWWLPFAVWGAIVALGAVASARAA
jgi:hypothetical protein